MHKAKHFTAYIEDGRQAEADGDPDKAIECYEAAIKQEPLEIFPYNRLMILYRKTKKQEKEIKVINKAIKVFTDYYDEKSNKLLHNKKLEMASRALLKTLTLPGQKAVMIYPEPIPGWIKRKALVDKKAAKKNK